MDINNKHYGNINSPFLSSPFVFVPFSHCSCFVVAAFFIDFFCTKHL